VSLVVTRGLRVDVLAVQTLIILELVFSCTLPAFEDLEGSNHSVPAARLGILRMALNAVMLSDVPSCQMLCALQS
jgi:hypothetical protein